MKLHTTLLFALFCSDIHASEIKEIIVISTFHPTSLTDLAGSTTIIDSEQLQYQPTLQINDVLNKIPNITFSGGTATPRFFQIRGIGERSQFIEPLNASVGVIIDGVDIAGLPLGTSMLDLDQIEVLRGPQGTLFGANALAGALNIITKRPNNNQLDGYVKLDLSSFNQANLSVASNLPLTEKVAVRVAVNQQSSDGFYSNTYLKRNDTNKIDQTHAQIKTAWVPTEHTNAEYQLTFNNNDNGYDIFNFDNILNTQSDQPGWDRSKSYINRLSLKHQADHLSVTANISTINGDASYAYDEDWSYIEFSPSGYSSFDQYDRTFNLIQGEVKFQNNHASLLNTESQWTAGIYYRTYDENLSRYYTYLDTPFESSYQTNRTAVFAQLDNDITSDISSSIGLRIENREDEYYDNRMVNEQPQELLWGGRASINYQMTANTSSYVLVSKGFKAGGFNNNIELPSDKRTYNTETLINYEIGVKASVSKLNYELSMFYQKRRDAQIKQSRLISKADGSTQFIDYTDNSSDGLNYGIEISTLTELTSSILLSANLGLLHTKLNQSNNIIDGREQAYSPNYTYATSTTWNINSNWTAKLELEGKDDFYFSVRHNEKSEPYFNLNMSINYILNATTVMIWAKNITNETIYTRGFGSFGNDPSNGYMIEPYYQIDNPRQIGISAKRVF